MEICSHAHYTSIITNIYKFKKMNITKHEFEYNSLQ